MYLPGMLNSHSRRAFFLEDTMQKRKLCQTCYGSTQMEAGGFMKKECTVCEDGYIYLIESKSDQELKLDKKSPKIDRRSKEYKNTIKELQKLGMSEEEAHKQFEEAEKDYESKPDQEIAA